MSKSVDEQLADVLTAIDAVQSKSQRQRMKDRELQRADLGVLDKRAQRLERAAARRANGGLKIQRVIPV